MNILIIQPWIRLGGAEMVSVNLACELQHLGHQVALACTYFDDAGMPAKAREIAYRLPAGWISRLMRKNRMAFLLFGPWIMLWLVWRHSREADVLNAHEFPSSWIAVVVGAIRGIPVVWSSYGPTPRLQAGDALKVGLADWLGWLLASGPLDRFMVRRIAAIHVPSERSRRQIFARYKREATMLPLGVDTDFFGAGGPRRAGRRRQKNGKLVLLSVGKLHPQENQEVCLRALKMILPRHPNACLVIAGDGPMLGRYRHLASELGIADSVQFLGHVPCWVVRDLYQRCHVHLYPPKNESWGLAPFEALSAGKISVVSRESGAAEVIGKQGIGLVSEPTAAAFAHHLRVVLADSLRIEQLARKGREYVSRHLTWRQHASGFLEVVRKVS